MKIPGFFLISLIPVIISGCGPKPDRSVLLNNFDRNFENGKFQTAAEMADSLVRLFPDDKYLAGRTDSLLQIAERISLDFPVTEEQFINKLENYNLTFNDSLLNVWYKKKWLEWRIINGEKKYFNRSASNLMLLKLFYEDNERQILETGRDPEMISRLEHTWKVMNVSKNNANPVCPVNMAITYTITVDADVLPDGEIIRCWMPWPKSNHPRQQKIELLSVSDKDFIIAPDSALHSSIYIEERSLKGIETIFRVSFSYQSSAQYANMKSLKPEPYDKESSLFKKYTSEELPQICFTDNVKSLADSLTSPDDDPAEIVKKIYLWFKGNIPWTGALEYSTMPNIPEYVYKNRRGDCGMQTFMFMSMLRYKGVPVRWQSGWKVPPDHKNLHDWCEVYYEGAGWIPADVSYDLQFTDNKALKEFYLSGIDSYRLIVNDGVAGPLYPEKQHLRSEPFDFQRGEVEWNGGNLYFDKWDYEMEIEYLD